MAGYHLWHPAYVIAEPLTLEAFVTRGDALLPPLRPDSAVLATLGLDVKTRGSRADVIRTHYFSSYRGETGDWEDDWAIAWRVRVTLLTERAPTLPAPPDHGYFDLEVGSIPPPADTAWPCVLIADAPEDGLIEEAASIVADRHHGAECEYGRASGRHPQLRCDLGRHRRKWYQDGAAGADATLEALTQAGATVRAP